MEILTFIAITFKIFFINFICDMYKFTIDTTYYISHSFTTYTTFELLENT